MTIVIEIKKYIKRLLKVCDKKKFIGSAEYWEMRYKSGGNSGEGSYNHLAEFKTDVINSFIKKNSIKSVIDFGFGDGNQLTLLDIPKYVGFDVSSTALIHCRELFTGDSSKEFRLLSEYSGEKAELALSLDVIFHLVEDKIYISYMKRLFESAINNVIIYSSNKTGQQDARALHFKHRKFTKWVEENCSEWKLIEIIPNRYTLPRNDLAVSVSDFYIYNHVTVQNEINNIG